ILLFLVLHLYHFWVPNRYQQLVTGHEKDLYLLMELTFKDLWVVIVYILGCISLAYHLLHGFWSAFQTLGLSTKKYTGLLRCVGTVYSIVIPLIFIAMPLSFYLGLLPDAETARAAAQTLAH